MTKDQLKAKYARISHDDSQLEMFKNDLIDGEIPVGGGSVDIAGNSLVIPEQPAPEPVATIDGVNYYHKQEFDLEAIAQIEDIHTNKYFDILTAEELDASLGTPYPCLSRLFTGFSRIMLDSGINSAEHMSYSKDIYPQNLASYSSHAFILTETSDVTSDNEIYLPTCSAYYGFLSEDGKTFISYFNLKVEPVPTKVNSIKQGSSTIPVVDDRLPAAEQADAGKVLKVAAAGGYELGESGGTQLYKHEIHQTSAGGNLFCVILSTDNTEIVDTSSFNSVYFARVITDLGVMKAAQNGTQFCFLYSGMNDKFINRTFTDFTTYTDVDFHYQDLKDVVTAL